MNKNVIVVFETLEKSKDILKQIEPSFYPVGTFWLLGFAGGELRINLEEKDSLSSIDETLFGRLDFILLKDAVLNNAEVEILSKIIWERDLYIIYHFRSIEVRESNEALFHAHEKIKNQYKFAISQSHLDGEFYFDELVKFLECIQNDGSDRISKYDSLLQNIIEKRFPDPVLEAKLNLLHYCLTFEDAKTAELPELLKNEFSECFRQFQEELAEKNHFEKLTILRDALLGH